MHEAGIARFPADNQGSRRPAAGIRDGWRRQGLRPRSARSSTGSTRPASSSMPGPTTASCPVRKSASPRATRCASSSTNELPESTADPLARPDRAERPGRRAFITQPPIKPGETLHLRVPDPRGQCRLATCTTRITTRRSRSSMGLLGAFIVEPKDPADAAGLRPRIHHDPQRRPDRRLQHQWQGLSGHPAAHREARARRSSSAT